jgi:hypothetical protein
LPAWLPAKSHPRQKVGPVLRQDESAEASRPERLRCERSFRPWIVVFPAFMPWESRLFTSPAANDSFACASHLTGLSLGSCLAYATERSVARKEVRV